jgi:hypothetical protein
MSVWAYHNKMARCRADRVVTQSILNNLYCSFDSEAQSSCSRSSSFSTKEALRHASIRYPGIVLAYAQQDRVASCITPPRIGPPCGYLKRKSRVPAHTIALHPSLYRIIQYRPWSSTYLTWYLSCPPPIQLIAINYPPAGSHFSPILLVPVTFTSR